MLEGGFAKLNAQMELDSGGVIRTGDVNQRDPPGFTGASQVNGSSQCQSNQFIAGFASGLLLRTLAL